MIEKKVTASSVGSVGLGGALAYMTFWMLRYPLGYPPEWFSTEFAINMTAIYCGLGALIGGYFRRG